MLRLGATQVKQVAHHAPNGIPSRPPAVAGRDVATPIYDVPRVYAAERGFAGVSLHFIVSIVSDVRALDGCPSPISDRHPEARAQRASKDERPQDSRRHTGPSPFEALASLGHLRVTVSMSVARRPFDIPRILALSIVPSPLVSARRSAHGSSRFLCRPRTRGAAERRKAHTGSSITLARRDAALTARGDPGATGIAPLGAPPWRFPAAGPRFNSGSVHRIHVATCPPARSQDLADWVPYLPRRGSLPSATGRHAPLRL